MKTDHIASCATSTEDSSHVAASLFLDVQKGRTAFRRRPVEGRRFLIGAGRQCDLRLGGDSVPALHSVIHRSGCDVWIDAFAQSPPLRVNGRDVDLVRLQDGDSIEIGEFHLTVGLHLALAADGNEPASSESASIDAIESQIEETPIEELSAAELVDLIEGETKLISEFEDRQQLGAEALLEQVLSRATEVDTAASRSIRIPAGTAADATEMEEQSLLGDLERVLLHLHRFSQKLENRSQRLLEREATHADAASTLLDAQHQLAAHLDRVIERIHAEQPPQARPTRASA